MGRPRQVSDEAILSAVRSAVTDEGPRVSLEHVAERLGVTGPALLRRFGSRNELLLKALRPEERPPFVDDIESGPDERPVQEQLAHLFVRIGDYLSGIMPCLSALRESGIPFEQVTHSFEEAPPVRATKALAAWLERATQRGLLTIEDAQSTAMAMIGAVQFPIFLQHLTKRAGRWDPVAQGRRLAELFIAGICPAAPRGRGGKRGRNV